MTAINFPDAPETGDTFTVGDTTWEWTGVVWEGFGDVVPGPTGDTGPAGPGVAPGGTAGQVLAKASATDYDSEWVTVTVDPTPQIFLLMGS